MRNRLVVTATTACALGLAVMPAAAQSVTTYHNGVQRHGAYVVAGLTAASAGSMHLDAAFNASANGAIYAQPLYWHPAGAAVGSVIVASETNQVQALNAHTGAPVWQTQLPAAARLSALGCGNIDPEGITGTPAIDPASGTIYLDAVTDVAPSGVRHLIYALSAATGAVLPNWPLDVQAAVTAQGVAFDSTIQGERGALLLTGGNLYVTYGGRSGDCGSYHGTVIELGPNGPPKVTGIWTTHATGGGIWAQGGIASDGVSLFSTTGNTFGANGWSDGEAIIRLRSGLAHSNSVNDYFTPANWQQLDNTDLDLGGTEALPLAVPNATGQPTPRVIAFGKDGNAYVADRTRLGGIGGQVAMAQVSNSEIITSPAVYNTASAAMVVFRNGAGRNCSGSSVSMLDITESAMPIKEVWCAPLSGSGAPIMTTSNGTADPLVWIAGAEGDNLLHGYNAMTGAAVFTGGSQPMSGLHHFVTILAANHHLYVGADNRVYGFTFTP